MVAAAISSGVRFVASNGARLAPLVRQAAERAGTFIATHTPEVVKTTIGNGMAAGRNVLARASQTLAPVAEKVTAHAASLGAKVAPHVNRSTIAKGAIGSAVVDTGIKLATGDEVTAGGIVKSAAVGGVLAPFFGALLARRALPATPV